MRVAVGLKARTGRAVAVVVGGEPLQVMERTQMRLLPEGAFAPYHVAAELPASSRQASVERDVAAARRLAELGLREVCDRLHDGGHQVCACGVLTGGTMPPWSTEDIVAVHVRMHQAEGKLFRDVLVAGARACGFEPATLRERSALDDAASVLRLERSELESRLAALGRRAGAPWGRDQKHAALAAMVALSQA